MNRLVKFSLLSLLVVLTLAILPAMAFAEEQGNSTNNGNSQQHETITLIGGVDTTNGYATNQAAMQWSQDSNTSAKDDGNILHSQQNGNGMDWPDWLLLGILIFVCTFLFNLLMLLYCCYFKDCYLGFLQGTSNTCPKKSIFSAFEGAMIHTNNPIYYAALEQYPTRDEPGATYMLQLFDEAIREYTRRCRNTFNPLYWIKSLIYLPDTLIFLPKRIFAFLALHPNNLTINFCQIAWWLLHL